MLKSEQIDQLEQVSRQVRGTDAFNDADVAAKLKLTEDQKTKIKDLLATQQTQMREIFQGAQDDREGAMKKITALRTETKDKVVALFQRRPEETWETLRRLAVRVQTRTASRPIIPTDRAERSASVLDRESLADRSAMNQNRPFRSNSSRVRTR